MEGRAACLCPPFLQHTCPGCGEPLLPACQASVGWQTVYWPWEKTKIKGERCPLTHFFEVAYMNRTAAPWTRLKVAGGFFSCLKYTQGDSPPPKLWSGSWCCLLCQYSHWPQGLQWAGRRSRRWLCCFNTEGIFPREQLFGLVHWPLLQTQLLVPSNL